MGRRTDVLAVVVACDDGDLRGRVVTALCGTGRVDVVASVDTVRMVPSTSRMRPDAVVLVSPRPRHVDLGRLGTLARDRGRRAPALVLLADEPDAIADRARAAGAAVVAVVPGPEDAGELVAELLRRRSPSGN